ncbi:MAG TPA: hypothetical protein VFA44_15405 [Gaiellaceae bacterium]|nr:hypothetical protein [Gaiellaceae bacterium]
MASGASRPSLGRVLVERGVITSDQLEAALRVQRERGGMLGEILTARGWVSPLSIAAALARQREAERDEPEPGREPRPRGVAWKPLGTVLVERGCVSEVQLKQALAVQREEGGFLGEILVQRGWMSAADLVLALAAQLGLDFDASRAPGPGMLQPAGRREAHFEVFEQRGDQVVLLKRAATFLEATDFVFDEVLWQREPGELEIVRVDGDRREVAWSFKPGEASAHERQDLLSIFGYPVTAWRGPEFPNGNGPAPARGGRAAAAS